MAEKTKFSLQTIFFLALVAVIIVLVNLAYTNLILPKKTFYHKEELYQNYISKLDRREISYVFFGDSHTFHDVNPEFISDSYNYGTGAENYIKTYYKLRKMIYIDNVTVSTAVFEIDLHTFSTRLTDETNLFNELELYSKFVSLEEIRNVRKDSILKLWIEANIPFISNGKEFGILIYKPQLSEVNDLGWLKNKEDFSSSNKTDVALSVYKDTFEGHDRFSEYSVEYFKKTIELAKTNGINVVFIMYPYAREYEDALKANNNLSKQDYYGGVFGIVNSTLKDYYVLDYSQTLIDEDYLFGDPAHLNYEGAETFSKIVDGDLRELKLNNNFDKKSLKLPNFANMKTLSYFGIFLAFLEIILLIFMLQKD